MSKDLGMKRLLVLCLVLLPISPAQAGSAIRNPLNGSADPTLTYFNGNYYLATTLGNRIGMWRSASPSEVSSTCSAGRPAAACKPISAPP